MVKKNGFSNPKISETTHAISKISKDSETSAKPPDRFFLFFNFGRRNCTNHLVEVDVFLALRPENFEFSNPKISANTHAISKIPKDSETSAKILVTFFFFFDFGQRNCMNQLLEVFGFLDLRPEIFILNWYLPLIPLSFTDLVEVF